MGCFPGNEGFGKKGLLRLEGKFTTFPFFFPQKMFGVDIPHRIFGTGKRGHYRMGLFTGTIPKISRISQFSRNWTRKWSASPLFSTVLGFSRISTIHSSPFTCCFRNHSYVRYSQSKFTGEWFTNRSNHIQIMTPITRIVATKIL